MAWPIETTRLLRSLIGDDVPDYTYTDVRLKPLITSAAVFVAGEVDFTYNYVVDIQSDTVTPDPANVNDQDFQMLVAYKAAAILARNEYRIVTQKAVLVKDGPSTIDMRDTASKVKAWMDALEDAYEKAKIAYKTGDGMVGEAIVGPHNAGYLPDAHHHISTKTLDTFSPRGL
jgi:hypothetical protein